MTLLNLERPEEYLYSLRKSFLQYMPQLLSAVNDLNFKFFLYYNIGILYWCSSCSAHILLVLLYVLLLFILLIVNQMYREKVESKTPSIEENNPFEMHKESKMISRALHVYISVLSPICTCILFSSLLVLTTAHRTFGRGVLELRAERRMPPSASCVEEMCWICSQALPKVVVDNGTCCMTSTNLHILIKYKQIS